MARISIPVFGIKCRSRATQPCQAGRKFRHSPVYGAACYREMPDFVGITGMVVGLLLAGSDADFLFRSTTCGKLILYAYFESGQLDLINLIKYRTDILATKLGIYQERMITR